jgi:hypothetical protein
MGKGLFTRAQKEKISVVIPLCTLKIENGYDSTMFRNLRCIPCSWIYL